MQRRHTKHPMVWIFLVLLAMVVIGVGTLMIIDVPAPQRPIEKQLDAKAFLSPGQP